tara:strand:- start:103 stop:600 length:498 start_codon:yes stop_codon:yes gene_type:complete
MLDKIMSKKKYNIDDKIEDFKNKYSQSGSFDVKKEVDFMTQMNLYNNKKINHNILELEEIYQSQVKKLKNLEKEDPAKCIENCNNFLEQNEKIIDQQLESIIELDTKIRKVINECDKIEEETEELNELMDSSKFKEMAKKIKQVRSKIDDLNFFLVRKNISDYTN